MTMNVLTIYYDGNCAICSREMRWLGSLNLRQQLQFVDIQQPGFDPASLGVSFADLDREIHVSQSAGPLLSGIDAFIAIYRAVDKQWLAAVLSLPLIKPLWQWLYLRFARNRYGISRLLGMRVGAKCDLQGKCR
ncbi:DUF393 domain-containing protein [Pokkaliibacter plantistimulans]|uniref:DUF393 domain-containing protein n=1 Tax=Proteobacteria bacterium 228 TaxID=2083153 RepID=A0A2S5KQA4_9PROT|nr:DUF393 domain-containing protein [Pokkaliibacter plantistimulans]PPC76882.1 DUF393 domain-containing protein [Pokkaliibacter plantistimulans]